jgi:membrane protein DedA with SNARE-associated domain
VPILVLTFLLMVPESAALPVPSEATLLAAGVAVAHGELSWWAAVLAATAGNLAGSLALYALGRRHAPRPPRAGRTARALERCDTLFARHGAAAVFLARLMPLARSFVSWPAGRASVPLPRFLALTTAGCAIWAAIFVTAGAEGASATPLTLALLAAIVLVSACRAARTRALARRDARGPTT